MLKNYWLELVQPFHQISCPLAPYTTTISRETSAPSMCHQSS